MKIESDAIDWNTLKDKPFKILLSNFEQTIKLFKALGLDIEEVDGKYWLNINKDKVKGQC